MEASSLLILYTNFNEPCHLFFFLRAQSSSISKMEVSEDNEPALSKVDVVLTFTLEVRSRTLRRIPPIEFFFSRSEGLVYAEGAPTRFVVA